MPTFPSSTPLPDPFARRRRVRQWTLAAIVLALAVAVGSFTASRYRDRALERGRETSRAVVERVDAARDAYRADDRRRAETLLEEALALLDQTGPEDRDPLYLTVLVDLASLKLDVESPAPPSVAEAKELLIRAWQGSTTAETPVKARIAQARGYAEALSGDLESAEQWYEEAAALAPDDDSIQGKLHLLRATRQAKSPDDPTADSAAKP